MPTGWVGSNRRRQLPPDWARTCLRILKRDHHRCQWVRNDTGEKCGAHATDVDHRVPHSEGGTDQDQNLWALCTYHHLRKTGREGGKASGRARRARKEANAPTHPGLLPREEPRPHEHQPRRRPRITGDDPAPF